MSVCPVQKGGGETPGRLFATYADLMTELMIVTSYCGSLSLELTPGVCVCGGGGACEVYSTIKTCIIHPAARS